MSGGFVAAVGDPEIPERFWVADSTTVWVTHDGGTHFSAVFQFARAVGTSRASHVLEDDADLVRDLDAFEPADFDANVADTWVLEGEDTPIDAGGDARGTDESEPIADDADDELIDTATDDPALEPPDEDRLAPFERTAFGITRLRVTDDALWICTSRGLWRLSRAAVGVGRATEVRLGRRLGVNDVAPLIDGRVLAATDGGLWVVDGPQTTRARGIPYDRPVMALARMGSVLVAGSSDGLAHASIHGLSFRAFDTDRRGVSDLLVDGGRLIAAHGNAVSIRDLDGGDIIERSVPGATRLVRGGGDLLAIGPRGLWRYADGDWVRADEGLPDRRLSDGFESRFQGGTLHVVGARGAWRAVRRAFAGSGSGTTDPHMRGRPTISELLRHAERARPLTLSTIDAFARRERLAWLAPRIELRATSAAQREETFAFIPALDRHVRDGVAVWPIEAELRVMAYWDLMPAIIASLEPSQPRVYEASRITAREAARRLRETIPPLWGAWAMHQRELLDSTPQTTRDAIRAVLRVAHLEAQLHALSAGLFPVTTDLDELCYSKD